MTRLAAFTALLALGLAACGGSSDDQDAAAEPAPEPDPEPAAPAPPPADTPSGKPIMITEDFESALRVNTNQWATWEEFAARHPDGDVLSQDTGFSRPYGSNPYAGYDSIDQPPFFPVENLDDDRLPPKERVVLLDRSGETLVVPIAMLEAAGTLYVEGAGETLTVEWVPGVRSALNSRSIADAQERGSARVTNAAGELVAFNTPLWFAVAAFRPDAQIVGQ